MSDLLESEKKDLVLGINSFNKPDEKTGGSAWINLVTNLLFMKKGTYPTEPDMGCELQKYEFAFIDDIHDEVENTIQTQMQKYLPDIPLSSVTVTTEESSSGRDILLIVLEFDFSDNGETAVIAANKNNNLIDFAVSM